VVGGLELNYLSCSSQPKPFYEVPSLKIFCPLITFFSWQFPSAGGYTASNPQQLCCGVRLGAVLLSRVAALSAAESIWDQMLKGEGKPPQLWLTAC